MSARERWFWLVNGLLLLLFVWTLTEEATVELRVADGVCTAVLGRRSSEIPCGQLASVGLYVNGRVEYKQLAPLDWLAPRTAWRALFFQAGSGGNWRQLILPQSGGWRHVLGEWRYRGQGGAVHWPLPAADQFTIEAHLRRPFQDAGILLLKADSDEGWVFIISGKNRQGVWWRWQEGRPVEPLVGIPLQKSLVAQAQALLRQILRTHQVALLLWLVGWSLSKVVGQRAVTTNGRWPALNRSRWPVLAVMGLVFLATAFIATAVLERMPHVQDSVTYLFQAQTLAGGRLWADAPPQPASFEQEFLLVRDGRWFGKYPPGYPLLLALGVLARQPWLVNPILATLTVPLVYLLGRELYGRATGQLAILLMLTSPFFLFMSGSLMPHAAELFWTTLFLWSWLRATRHSSGRWVIVAGVALGFLFLTRQITAVIVAATFVPTTLLVTASRTGWRPLFKPLLLSGGIMAFFALLLLGYQTAVTGDPFTDPRLLYWEYDRPGFGPTVGERHNAFTVSLTAAGLLATNWYTDADQPPRGHTVARGLFNTSRNWQSLLENLYGWPPPLTLVFIWLLWLRQRLQWPDVALLALFGGTVAVYVAFWAAGIMYGPRYYYAALPALLLLTARGIQVAAAGWPNQGGRWLVTGLVVALVAGNLVFNMPVQLAHYWGYNFVTRPDLAELTENVPGPAVVFVADEGDWWEYGRYFAFNTPWLDGRFVFARDLGDEANGRLMAHFPRYQAWRWQNDELVQIMPRAENAR